LNIQDEELNSKMDNFKFGDNQSQILKWKRQQFMDFHLLGHQALSLNAIIANRASGTFSEDPYKGG
jgi:uridine phosphorylase